MFAHSLFTDPAANSYLFGDSCTRSDKFVAIGPNYSRLGNQLYHLASGYCIAKKINRIFYYPLKKGKRGLLLQHYLNLILKAFPKTGDVYKTFWKLRNFLIFGDEQDFMRTLASHIINRSTITEKRTAYVSTFPEMSDFYISSRLCRSFLLSAASSTMGWWLAFFARDQDAIYYYKDGRGANDFKISHDEFQLWVLPQLH
ncbi:hypothetical protein OESDEN_03261 [Oesophagostomum dentatum]|uniref:Uncharacterized protein n=1 Tax=Oesophagostomum dentatum TaxID=61180 RepID=A0A0B1TL05_OESDE|nr:hypothetical protein OESDEN_03261 [Oesophagostomum dentatum]